MMTESDELLLEEMWSATVASIRSDSDKVQVLSRQSNSSVESTAKILADVHGKMLVRNLFSETIDYFASPVEMEADDLETGIELEDSDSDGRAEPYDPDKIRVDPKNFSLKQVIDDIDNSDIDLAPDFQRDKVWKPRQKVRLIESVLLRIPLPAFYFSADTKGRLSVVDGVQRLSTIHAFVNGKFGLATSDLEYLKVSDLRETAGVSEVCNYADLSPQWRRRLAQTQITANVIDPQTPEQVKFDIFKRINTGGSPLSSQEIRHSMMRDRCRNLLKELASSAEFLDATPAQIHHHPRMVDREVILRFLAFSILDDVDLYPADSTMDGFLMGSIRELDDPSKVSEAALQKLKSEFRAAMMGAAFIFGEKAFRKLTRSGRKTPFNKALFESWAYALRNTTLAQLVPIKDQIYDSALTLMADNLYVASIGTSTGNSGNVRRRFSAASEIVKRYSK